MNDARAKTGLDLSLVQVVAGTGAALTAALLGSLFGIAGTLLGTGVGSMVATICTAVYTHQLRRTHDRLQCSGGFSTTWLRPSSLRRLPWLRMLAAAAVIFGFALAVLTVIESLVGRPLSSATGGSHAHAAPGTSVHSSARPVRSPPHAHAGQPDYAGRPGVGTVVPARPAVGYVSSPRRHATGRGCTDLLAAGRRIDESIPFRNAYRLRNDTIRHTAAIAGRSHQR